MAKNTPEGIEAPDPIRMAASPFSAITSSAVAWRNSISDLAPPETRTPTLPCPHENAACGLLKLPAELRNYIYELVLFDENMIEIQKDVVRKVALTQTCRQIRNETAGMFYALNTFLVRVNPTLLDMGAAWLRSLGSDARMITKLNVRVETYFTSSTHTNVHDSRAAHLETTMSVQALVAAGLNASTLSHALQSAEKVGLNRSAVTFVRGCESFTLYKSYVRKKLRQRNWRFQRRNSTEAPR